MLAQLDLDHGGVLEARGRDGLGRQSGVSRVRQARRPPSPGASGTGLGAGAAASGESGRSDGRRGAQERLRRLRRRHGDHSAAGVDPGGQIRIARVDRHAVVLREGDLDPHVEGDERADGEAGEEGDLVEGGEVFRVPHGEGEVPAEAPEGEDEEVRGELPRHETEDVGADLDEIGRRAGGDAVLHGERAEEKVLADSAQLQEVRADAPAQANLLGERPVPELRRDRFSSDQDFPDPTSHVENLAGTAATAG